MNLRYNVVYSYSEIQVAIFRDWYYLIYPLTNNSYLSQSENHWYVYEVELRRKRAVIHLNAVLTKFMIPKFDEKKKQFKASQYFIYSLSVS